ncbi:MAG: 5'-methylthioadenosine/S-adenosylhomocysteine nucleosidase [Gammaproteobacteria bacterium]|nr:5'-methylthioadenosine/S-adenosylhomocysteine nucleosidase [Gammaproteobacteria bacterium]
MRILILGAFKEELTAITHDFLDLKETKIAHCCCLSGRWHHHELMFALTGIGTVASAITTTILCDKLQPELIIFCGVAGGLKPDQRIGDLVIANKIIDADLYQLPALLKDTPYKNGLIDPHTLNIITGEYPVNPTIKPIIESFSFERLKLGIIVSSSVFPAPEKLFSKLIALDCSVIEMESAGLFKAAIYYQIPVITVRAISNLLDATGNDLGTTPEALNFCANRLAACLTQLLPRIQCLEPIAVDLV